MNFLLAVILWFFVRFSPSRDFVGGRSNADEWDLIGAQMPATKKKPHPQKGGSRNFVSTNSPFHFWNFLEATYKKNVDRSLLNPREKKKQSENWLVLWYKWSPFPSSPTLWVTYLLYNTSLDRLILPSYSCLYLRIKWVEHARLFVALPNDGLFFFFFRTKALFGFLESTAWRQFCFVAWIFIFSLYFSKKAQQNTFLFMKTKQNTRFV